MDNNEMVTKIFTLNAICARISRTGSVKYVERSLIKHLTDLDLPLDKPINVPELVEYLEEIVDDIMVELPAPFAFYLDQI